MPSLLHNVPVTDEQRRLNDTHRPGVVAAVILVLCLYAYLFTHAADTLGILMPEELVERAGFDLPHVFDDDHNVDSEVVITLGRQFRSNDDERLVFYLILACAFLSAYFLPVRHKQRSLVLWSMAAIFVLFSPSALAGMLAAHLVVFLVLHPQGRANPLLSGLVGVLCYLALLYPDWSDPVQILGLVASCLGSVVVYRYGVLRLLSNQKVAPFLRSMTVQSAILTVCVSALIEGLNGNEWSLPLGLLMFFWQWERLIMYHIDYKDGQIPQDISVDRYLAVFFNPGVVPNWNWGVSIPQGYAYTQNAFLCENKNKIVISGLRIWGVALLYLVFGDWVRNQLVELFTDMGIPVYRAYTKGMVAHFARGGTVSTPSVLATTMLDLIRWTILWAGVVHFKVGIWRVCGYRVDPYINHPWASTNLVTLWSRFTFHYREFLVRAFYYPVFQRTTRVHPYVRVMLATMAAACVGNLIWGHVPERMFYRGMELENLVYYFSTWPYFVLLGLGIGFSQVYLMWRKRKRKPWTWDRWIATDVVAAYCTLQYYALIHIFVRPTRESTLWDQFRLFARGFGIELG